MHGAIFLDADDNPVRPAILWNDGRSFAECEELARRVPDFLARAGNLAMPGFTAPKAMWLAKHEPEAFRATKRVLLPKDYVRLRLTGERATDCSDASGTLFLDVGARAWSDEILDVLEVDRGWLPEVFEGPEVTGTLRGDVEPEDVLRAMGAIWLVADGDDFAEQAMRILRLVLDGLRYRA